MYGRSSLDFALEHLRAGRDLVLLGNDFEFSISEDSEREMKMVAEHHNCWVLTPHGYAHEFLRGPVGLVGTAGTAIQHVGCMLHGHGIGVSRIYAVGRRDMSQCIAGVETIRAFRTLAEHRDTEVIVVLLKAAKAAQLKKLRREAGATRKPVVAYVLDNKHAPSPNNRPNFRWAKSLEDVVVRVVRITRRAPVRSRVQWIPPRVDSFQSGSRERFCIRGFFSGGSCCDETVRTLRMMGLRVRTNSDVGIRNLAELTDGPGHVCIDLGGGLLTRGRFHQPMVNLSVKSSCILNAAKQARPVVVLMDVFLGHGSHSDPARYIAPAVATARVLAAKQNQKIVFIATVIGMDRDPQRVHSQEIALQRAGVILAPNVTRAAHFAGCIVANKT
jgi:FdrA protein